MSLLDSYRKHSFLQNETGSHLDQWRTSVEWKTRLANRGDSPVQFWSHHVLEPPEQALDYLDWLNKQHSHKPYLLRRLLTPAWLLLPIMEAVATQQSTCLQRFDQTHPLEIAAYVRQAQLLRLEIKNCLDQSAWLLPLVRAIRLNSEWLREREHLIQSLIEAAEPGSNRESVEVKARPWDRPGVGSWRAKEALRELLALQEKADEELFIVVNDFESTRAAFTPQQAKRELLLRSLSDNPRLGKGHYLFATAKQAIDYAVWLNHRHPERPYLLRRLFLPVRTLARMIEAIGNHQTALFQTLESGEQATVACYFSKAKKRAREIHYCVEQAPLGIPMMRVIRLNNEWLRDRQELIAASRRYSRPNESNPIEVTARLSKQQKDRDQSIKGILRQLLALQKYADKELSRTLGHFVT